MFFQDFADDVYPIISLCPTFLPIKQSPILISLLVNWLVTCWETRQSVQISVSTASNTLDFNILNKLLNHSSKCHLKANHHKSSTITVYLAYQMGSVLKFYPHVCDRPHGAFCLACSIASTVLSPELQYLYCWWRKPIYFTSNVSVRGICHASNQYLDWYSFL